MVVVVLCVRHLYSARFIYIWRFEGIHIETETELRVCVLEGLDFLLKRLINLLPGLTVVVLQVLLSHWHQKRTYLFDHVTQRERLYPRILLFVRLRKIKHMECLVEARKHVLPVKWILNARHRN